MTLFAQLLQEVADEKNCTLSSCLFKAKVLASTLRGRKFREWVDAELGGYSGKTLPPYRIVTCRVFGQFGSIVGHELHNVQLSVEGIDPKIREAVMNARLNHNIGGLESLLEGEGQLAIAWPPSWVSHYRHHGGTRYVHLRLTDAWSVIADNQIESVLHAIRFKLLDFMIELRERYPSLLSSEDPASTVPTEANDKLVETVIYHECTFNGEASVAKQQVSIGGSVSAGGNVVIADAINSSFNKVVGSAAPEPVKDELEELKDAVAELTKHLPAEKLEEWAKDVEVFVGEVTKAEPRRGMLEAAGDLLKGTAATVVQYGAPVVALVDSLTKLATGR